MVILVLAAMAWLWWWLYTPTIRFVQGFGALLESAEPQIGILSLIFGTPTVTGRFKDRRVVLHLVQPRRNRPGHVALSIETTAPDAPLWKDSRLTSQDGEISRATFDLEARYELILTMEPGWFGAKWRPSWRFPGPFDARRWQNTLAQMHVLVEWMEQRHRNAR